MTKPAAPPTEADVLQALRAVKDPDLHRDIVALGFVKNVRIHEGAIALDIELTTPACPVRDRMKEEAESILRALPGVTNVAIQMTAQVRKATVSPAEGGMRGVKNAVAIASGKGGVGKSTVATNLALALASSGAKVGLMDADVYGPSVPKMLGSLGKPEAGGKDMIRPLERYGVKFMSMGLFTGRDTPVIWRGPMATKLIQQFLGQVDWGDLDYLLIDLPPGTGDVQLTLTQSAPLAGAVIVTTPQDVAVGITMRGLRMFEQVHVPILGIVENMSGFVCEHCGERTDVFGRGGGRRAAEEQGVPFLGEVPLDKAVVEAGDEGRPVVMGAAGSFAPNGSETAKRNGVAQAFMEIAGRLAMEISKVAALTSAMKHHPAEVKLTDEAILVKWSDGHESAYGHRALRVACPCAICVDEWTGEPRIDPVSIPQDVRALEMRTVGRYALQFTWSDGHSSGIYTYDRLRSLDPKAPAGEAPRRGTSLPVVS